MSRNQQKNAKKVNLTEYLQSFCGVCFMSFQKKTPKKLNQGLDILACTKCKCLSHQSCYGFQTNTTLLSQGIRQFLCDRCAHETPLSSCIVCRNKTGVMKELQNSKGDFVHIFCALTHDQIDAVEYYPNIRFRLTQSFIAQKNEYKCEICGNEGAHQSCAEQTCSKKVHTYCARVAHKNGQQSEQLECWKFYLQTGDNKSFDLQQEKIKKQWLTIQADKALQKFQSFKQIPTPNKDPILDEIYQNYLRDFEKQKKADLTRLRRGGFSYVFCGQHGVEIYCICFMKNQGAGDMVQCDCCFQWYHLMCVKFQPSGVNESYICHQCTDFYELKKKIVEEVRNNKTQMYEIKTDMPHKSSLFDYIWMLRVVDLRISNGGASKLYKIVAKLPIKSSKIEMIAKHQNKNQLSNFTDQFLKEYLKEQINVLKSFPVLELDESRRPIIITPNIQKNKKLSEYVSFARTFAKNNRLPDIYPKIVQELEFKQSALTDQYEQIVNLSKCKQYYPEIEVLRVKAQAYSFMDIIKKVNSGSIIQFQDLQQAHIKAREANVPEYLLSPLRQRYQKANVLVKQMQNQIYNNTESLQSLQRKAKQLQTISVGPPRLYKQFKTELKFLNDLYLFYLKETGGQINIKKPIASKLEELIQETQIQGNRQLSQIVNSLHLAEDQVIIKGLAKLIQKYSEIAVQNQIKNALKTQSISYQRLQKLLKKTNNNQLQSYSEQVRAFIKQWIQIKQFSLQVLQNDLTQVDQLGSIEQQQKKVSKLASMMASLPIKLESSANKEGVNPIVKNISKRKQQLNQLKILYTEVQFEKNPLSLQKISKDLPRNNELVANYFKLKKQSQRILQKYNRMSKRIHEKITWLKNSSKKSKKQIVKQNNEKPNIVEVTQLIEDLSQHKISFYDQINKLTDMINNSIEIASQIKKYISKLPDQTFQKAKNIEQLSKARKQIDQLKKKIFISSELSLKQELESLYQLQSCIKIKSLLISHTSDLQKVGRVLKTAEQQGLTHLTSYMQLRNNFKTKTQTKEEVALVQSLQHQLIVKAERDKDYMYAGLQAFRKTLTLPELPQRDKNSKEELLQGTIEKNKALRRKIQNILGRNPSKFEFNQARQVFLEALKNPYNQPKLSNFSHELNKFNKLLQKWRQGTKPTSSRALFFQSYDQSALIFDEIQQVRTSLKSTEEALDELQQLISVPSVDNSFRIQEIIDNLEALNASRQLKAYQKARVMYINYWIDQIKQAEQKKQSEIVIDKFKRILFQSYSILQARLRNRENYSQLEPIIDYLQALMEKVKTCLKNRMEGQQVTLVQGFIDVRDLAYEAKSGQEIDDHIIIEYPFRNLSDFKYVSLIKMVSQKEIEETHKRPKAFQSSHNDDFHVKSPSKIVKVNENQSEQRSEEQLPLTVTDSQRRRIKQILAKNMKKNNELNTPDIDQYVKMIENQIFGSYHNNVIKYLETSDQYQKLFIKLLDCPKISQRIAKKKFQFQFIELLVNSINKIKEYQVMMTKKNDEQEREKREKQKLQETKNRLKDEQEKKKKEGMSQSKSISRVIEMIESGNIDENEKRGLKKQIKAIKQSSRHRDHKDKHKKRKHKHSRDKSRSRSRSRSRSKSPRKDAKFSSDSEQEQQLPAYIQKQYNRELGNEGVSSPMPEIPVWDSMNQYSMGLGDVNQAPMMFDPEEDMEKQQQSFLPRGSVLRIKEAQLEFILKKKGKVEMKGVMLSDEDHRKILLELVDPGFTKISIKREKSQEQIIQYLNKPSKKKYKFLVGWFEALEQKNNQLLRQLAAENTEKKKIFGLQNEHVKMHIMSIRQLIKINRFHTPPSRVTTQSAAKVLKDDRMVFVIQYPGDKMYQLKGIFQNFDSIENVQKTIEVGLPIQTIPIFPAQHSSNIPLMPFDNFTMIPQPVDNTYDLIMSAGLDNPGLSRQNLQSQNFNKSLSHNVLQAQNDIEYQGWGNNAQTTDYVPVQSKKSYDVNIGQSKSTYHFSPILTEEEDNGRDEKDGQKDFASNILNSISEMSKGQSEITTQFSQQARTMQSGNMGYRNYQYPNQRWNNRPGFGITNANSGVTNSGVTNSGVTSNAVTAGSSYNPNPMLKYPGQAYNNPNSNPMYRNPMHSNMYQQPTIRDNRMNYYQNNRQPYQQIPSNPMQNQNFRGQNYNQHPQPGQGQQGQPGSQPHSQQFPNYQASKPNPNQGSYGYQQDRSRQY